MMSRQPTASDIRSAKSRATGGGRKRCRRGKNCSAACINASMVCLVELPESTGASLSRASSFLSKRAPSLPSSMRRELAGLGGGPTDVLDVKAKTVERKTEGKPPWSATGNTKWAREDAEDFDIDLVKKGKSEPVRRVGEKTYDKWSDSYGSGASKVGEGSYGTVIRNKDGTYIKRGAISDTEAELINRVGKADLGPRLKAADINGKHDWHDENFVNIRNGRIAMTGVPGKPIGDTAFPDTKLGGRNAADVYWSAMGNLHKLGIAHNDAHVDNILVDDKGKGRWVDLGLAQASPKAAFLEAFGTFTPANKSGGSNWKEGNWQTSRWRATGIEEYFKRNDFGRGKEFLQDGKYKELRTVIENQPKVLNKLRSMGFSVSEIDQLIKTPIRSTPETFQQGPWAKMTDAQAKVLIDTFYDGI